MCFFVNEIIIKNAGNIPFRLDYIYEVASWIKSIKLLPLPMLIFPPFFTTKLGRCKKSKLFCSLQTFKLNNENRKTNKTKFGWIYSWFLQLSSLTVHWGLGIHTSTVTEIPLCDSLKVQILSAHYRYRDPFLCTDIATLYRY